MSGLQRWLAHAITDGGGQKPDARTAVAMSQASDRTMTPGKERILASARASPSRLGSGHGLSSCIAGTMASPMPVRHSVRAWPTGWFPSNKLANSGLAGETPRCAASARRPAPMIRSTLRAISSLDCEPTGSATIACAPGASAPWAAACAAATLFGSHDHGPQTSDASIVSSSVMRWSPAALRAALDVFRSAAARAARMAGTSSTCWNVLAMKECSSRACAAMAAGAGAPSLGRPSTFSRALRQTPNTRCTRVGGRRRGLLTAASRCGSALSTVEICSAGTAGAPSMPAPRSDRSVSLSSLGRPRGPAAALMPSASSSSA